MCSKIIQRDDPRELHNLVLCTRRDILTGAKKQEPWKVKREKLHVVYNSHVSQLWVLKKKKNGVKMNLRMPLEIIPPSENIREFPVGL